MSHDLRQQRRPVRPGRRPSAGKLLLAFLVAIAAVVALFATGIVAEQYRSGQPVAATPTTKAAGPAFGDAARDGRFEFVVARMDCSRTTIGVEHLKRTAAGRYCVVSLSVRNVGDGAKFFVGHAQKAYDASGAEYGSDELAGVYANRGTEAFLRRLEPGQKTAGKLVFDVPKATKLTTLELHDSLLSSGVRITLG
jgi:hypothetical protein